MRSVKNSLQDWVVIFDLDGTLIDTAPDLAAATNHVLKQHGHAPLPVEVIRPHVGDGARAMLKAGFAHYGQHDFSDMALDEMVVRFLDHYLVNYAEKSAPFSGLTECLEQLEFYGAKLAICTNKKQELAHLVLEAFELAHWFDPIICRDSLSVWKPDPMPLIECVDRAGAKKGVMIGDTRTDLNAALNANMPCILVEFGYGEFSATEKKQAKWLDKYSELPSLLGETTSGGA